MGTLSFVVSAAPSSWGGGLLTLFLCSRSSASALVWGPSHGRQSSINISDTSPSCRLQLLIHSTVDSFHGMQPTRKKLVQCGPPWVLMSSSKLALDWDPLPWGHGSVMDCFSTGFPQGHSLLWASTCSCLDPCSPGATMGCSSTAASPLSYPEAAGESLQLGQSIPLPLL